jgi:hypothetical protein
MNQTGVDEQYEGAGATFSLDVLVNGKHIHLPQRHLYMQHYYETGKPTGQHSWFFFDAEQTMRNLT